MLREITLCFVLCLVCLVHSHKKYLDNIPNSHSVVSPCDQSKWPALGHKDANDGHAGENKFGKDYKHNHQWSALCKLDSDGDGKTNGEELGDPSCIWTPHGNHNLKPVTGHPGICEPVGSPTCLKQEPFNCKSGFGSHHHHG